MWFQNRRAKWRKKENTKKGPGRPAHNAHPTTCSGEPMDPEEIARRELDRLEKKKRKQERRLLKSQNKLLSGGDLFHTPGSDSDSGVSHVTDSDHGIPPHYDTGPSAGSQSSCELQSNQNQNQNQRHQDLQDASGSELDSPDPGPRSGVGGGGLGGGGMVGGGRVSAPQKLNPFSVESLLSDSRPTRRTPAALPPSTRPLIGKGHFLLYPITQPLGFIVPQTALKTNCEGSALVEVDDRRTHEAGSPDAHRGHASTAVPEVDMAHICSSSSSGSGGGSTSGKKSPQKTPVICNDKATFQQQQDQDVEHLESKEQSVHSDSPTPPPQQQHSQTDCKEDVGLE